MNSNIIRLGMVILFLASCSESKETRMQRFLAQGNDMMTRKNYNEATNFYEGALKLDSCFTEALNNLGTVFYAQGDYQSARITYSRAIDCKTDFLPAYINRSNSYFRLRLYNKALEDLNYVRTVRPDTMVVHYLLGLAYTELREYSLAKKSFLEALDKDPGNAELLTNLAAVHYYEDDLDSAQMFVDKAMTGERTEPNALNLRALIATERGNYNEAHAMLEKAISMQPRNAYYLNNRGYLYLMQNELEKAVADIDESIITDPDNGWAYRNKGIYHLKKDQLPEALRLLKLAEEKDKEIDDLYYYLAEASWAEGSKSQACVYYALALKRGDVSPEMIRKRCP